MQPLSGGTQKCLAFRLTTAPNAQIFEYRDYLGNVVNHFDIPDRHSQLTVIAESVVSIAPGRVLPETLEADSWSALDALTSTGDFCDMLSPSVFARPSDMLQEMAVGLGANRRNDPLTTLRELSSGIHHTFEYAPQSTNVDSPIDEALRSRKGVCQDFSHIMIAMIRELGIPARYVSGYLYHRLEDHDRSAADATHAWVEALLPELGWIGFDPTNNTLAGERHVRVAVGRDYADVPPTRGVFQGDAESELEVAVQVLPSDPLPPGDSILTMGDQPPPEATDWHSQQ